NEMRHLGSTGLPTVIPTAEGDGRYFVGVTDTGRRVQIQWTGSTLKDVYAIDPTSGERILVKKNLDGQVFPSAAGRYIFFYDNKAKNYFAWDGKKLRNVSSKITVPLYDEENDKPEEPDAYGVMGWQEGDSAVYVYDRFDVWKLDPLGIAAPQRMTNGRSKNISFRYLRVNNDERFIKAGQTTYFKAFDRNKKSSGIAQRTANKEMVWLVDLSDAVINTFVKAENAPAIVFSKENYSSSPDLYLLKSSPAASAATPQKLTSLNPQQSSYYWGTAELFHWTTFNGKKSTGILYKPENFDPKKKYPMIIYFYEKLSDGLFNYIAPEPTRSRLNIPFFVSRGYLVFAPDISYTKGHPGKDAYNYIVSGAQALAKQPWVDAKNIGIQGQSWGGYQVAYLITATNLFKAAWAGAPVVNMFSAYGGIRWESGMNRQFQYEKSQSRIGATPWERPDLYIENSPFFHLKNVKTPLVIMANDADGAVPWYQGIEFFTAMRRLGKPVWLLNYNGEAHNLVERRNKKDIQIREQQYFDWLLKGARPPKWITQGVPAVKKGKDWGLELVD
ncbi:MAG TPA: prolyl oligopeptidase family serine peptidase, partial [Flavisolibacter sp.]|nr:prolyl oligopeptidase family serine peptidase [Flavisolibacter sp.]